MIVRFRYIKSKSRITFLRHYSFLIRTNSCKNTSPPRKEDLASIRAIFIKVIQNFKTILTCKIISIEILDALSRPFFVSDHCLP